MNSPFEKIIPNNIINPNDYYTYNNRGTLIEIHTADLHFGAMDPKIQYDILMTQLVSKVSNLNFDVFFINGDIFHHKFMSNSDVIMYASMFIDQVVQLCRNKNATLVILHGTASHDANQLKLFYHYIGTLDIRIIEHIQFEMIKGSKVLCIPEEYNMGSDYYINMLYNMGSYDMAVLHGAVKGSIFGCNEENISSNKAPVFDINSFRNCNGPIICGHVHIPGCYQQHIYYSGSPLRWQFGEEESKGFIICLHNLDSHQSYIHLEEITSFRYDTITLDDMINNDPKDIISYVSNLKSQGIDYIKIRFTENSNNVNILKKYYKNDFNTVIDASDIQFQETIKENQKANEKFQQYSYIMDDNLSPYEIFTRYVNQCKGEQFISVDELTKILSD